jgi:hypothetical protein
VQTINFFYFQNSNLFVRAIASGFLLVEWALFELMLAIVLIASICIELKIVLQFVNPDSKISNQSNVTHLIPYLVHSFHYK